MKRFGETEEQAERNLDNMARAFGTFLALYIAGGGRVIPETDAEFHVEGITGAKGRPVIAVSGTPDQVIDGLQQVIDETGARRLLVETFSRDEARLFAREVIPVLRERPLSVLRITPFTSSAVPVASAASNTASRSRSMGGRPPIMRAERCPIIRTDGSCIAVTMRLVCAARSSSKWSCTEAMQKSKPSRNARS